MKLVKKLLKRFTILLAAVLASVVLVFSVTMANLFLNGKIFHERKFVKTEVSMEGYSFGYELSLRKDKGWWFGGINWSQSISVARSNDGTKPYFPSWHQPYALKMDLGITIRQRQ